MHWGSYTPVISLKTLHVPERNGQSQNPFSDQNNDNTISFGAAHTYVAYIREVSPETHSISLPNHRLLLVRQEAVI